MIASYLVLLNSPPHTRCVRQLAIAMLDRPFDASSRSPSSPQTGSWILARPSTRQLPRTKSAPVRSSAYENKTPDRAWWSSTRRHGTWSDRRCRRRSGTWWLQSTLRTGCDSCMTGSIHLRKVRIYLVNLELLFYPHNYIYSIYCKYDIHL